MQFRDLKKQYESLKLSIDTQIQSVITSASFISGPQVKELETQLAEYTGVKHCITCGNGTDAISMALMAWDIKEGDAAFVPDFTFFASGETVSFEGATPVFVDVDKDTFNMDPDRLEEAINLVLEEGRLTPRVIVTVDLFGLPANYPRIREIADRYGLKILEDSAQGFGGMIGTERAGIFGDMATTSFFPAKPLGCYGDGGAIFVNDDETAAYLESIRVHGKGSFKYDNVRIGWNSRLDTLQAAILLPKFKAFCEYDAFMSEILKNLKIGDSLLEKTTYDRVCKQHTRRMSGLIAWQSVNLSFIEFVSYLKRYKKKGYIDSLFIIVKKWLVSRLKR